MATLVDEIIHPDLVIGADIVSKLLGLCRCIINTRIRYSIRL